MAFCERTGLTAAARQIALAAMDAVHGAFPAGSGPHDSSDHSSGPRVQRQGRLAGNLFAYCLQAGQYEVGPSLSRALGVAEHKAGGRQPSLAILWLCLGGGVAAVQYCLLVVLRSWAGLGCLCI